MKPDRTTTTLLDREDSAALSLTLLKQQLEHGSVSGVGSSLNVRIEEDGRKSIRTGSFPEEIGPPAAIEIARQVIRSRSFQEAVEVFPRNEIAARTVKGGAPAHHPDFILFFAIVLTSRLGSQREAIRFLRTSPVNWRAVRREFVRAFPQYTVPLHAPKRGHLQHFVRRIKSTEGKIWAAKIRVILRRHAIEQAESMGLLPEHASFSYRDLDLRQWVASDGTVFAPPSKRKSQTKPGQHIDDASGYHIKNGKDVEYGSQYVFTSMRTLDPWSRLIMDAQHVTPVDKTKRAGNEGEVIHQMVTQLKSEIPGLRGLVVDSVIRGHRVLDLAERGVHVVNYPHAQANPNRAGNKRLAPDRIEKSHKITTASHLRPNGRPCKHDLYAEGGQVMTGSLDASGKLVMVPVEVSKYEERRSRKGTYKYYFVLQLRCAHGYFEHRIGLFHTAEGELDFNRGEYLRLYAPKGEHFNAVYGRRNDTENSHANFKSRMPRMRAYGEQAQTMIVLGLMLQENVVTAYVVRQAAQLRRSTA